MSARNWVAMLVCVALCRCGWGEHSPLLPRPQQVRYGTGSVALRAMCIIYGSAADVTDRFAAEQLRSWLEERTGLAVSIVAFGNTAGGALPIVLEREGNQDRPLALPGERPGRTRQKPMT